ncbi:MAG: hypothetical protein IT256_07000 [Chitinophagaceae bacterium]|nr:hypothetical protein [Chitinophagaceae bacterium]
MAAVPHSKPGAEAGGGARCSEEYKQQPEYQSWDEGDKSSIAQRKNKI